MVKVDGEIVVFKDAAYCRTIDRNGKYLGTGSYGIFFEYNGSNFFIGIKYDIVTILSSESKRVYMSLNGDSLSSSYLRDGDINYDFPSQIDGSNIEKVHINDKEIEIDVSALSRYVYAENVGGEISILTKSLNIGGSESGAVCRTGTVGGAYDFYEFGIVQTPDGRYSVVDGVIVGEYEGSLDIWYAIDFPVVTDKSSFDAGGTSVIGAIYRHGKLWGMQDPLNSFRQNGYPNPNVENDYVHYGLSYNGNFANEYCYTKRQSGYVPEVIDGDYKKEREFGECITIKASNGGSVIDDAVENFLRSATNQGYKARSFSGIVDSIYESVVSFGELSSSIVPADEYRIKQTISSKININPVVFNLGDGVSSPMGNFSGVVIVFNPVLEKYVYSIAEDVDITNRYTFDVHGLIYGIDYKNGIFYWASEKKLFDIYATEKANAEGVDSSDGTVSFYKHLYSFQNKKYGFVSYIATDVFENVTGYIVDNMSNTGFIKI